MRGLLIGGSSCVGKTTTAVRVCTELQAAHYRTDCILPRTPILRPLDEEAESWDRPSEELYRLLVNAAAAAVPFLLHNFFKDPDGWQIHSDGKLCPNDSGFNYMKSRLLEAPQIRPNEAS